MLLSAAKLNGCKLQTCTSSLVDSIFSSVSTCKCFLSLVLLTVPYFSPQDHWHSGVCSQHFYVRRPLLTINCYRTGSAGLIQTISMFAHHTWGAAIVGLIATIGWVIQGVGNMYYYRQVRICYFEIHGFRTHLFIRRYTPTIQPQGIRWKRLVMIVIFWQLVN